MFPRYTRDIPVGLVGLVVLVGLVGLCRSGGSGGVGWSCGFGWSSVPTYHTYYCAFSLFDRYIQTEVWSLMIPNSFMGCKSIQFI